MQFRHQRARTLSGEPAHLPREMRLVGVTSLNRQRREPSVAVRQKAQEALEAKDPLQCLRPIAECFHAPPAQGALAPAELVYQSAHDSVGARAFLRRGSDSCAYDWIGRSYLRQMVDQRVLENRRRRRRILGISELVR